MTSIFPNESRTSTSADGGVITRWTSSRGLAVQTRGDGDPILLLHGIGGSGNSCTKLAARLADAGYSTYCWDAPGYGNSADPAGDLDAVGELLALCDELAALGIAPLHMFGTSWGGVLAMELSMRRPDMVVSLILADSTRGSGVSHAQAEAMRQRVVELGELGGRAFADGRASRLVSPSSSAADLEAVRAEMARVRLPGYAAAAEYMASRNLGPDLSRIVAPTLVVVGADDVVTGVDESRLLANEIPDARLVVIDAAGHAAVSEQPGEMAVHVREFLDSLVRGPQCLG